MSYLFPTLWSAFNVAFLGIKERFKSTILPLLYIKFLSSWVPFFKARNISVGLTKAVNTALCCMFILMIQCSDYPLLLFSPSPICLGGIEMLFLCSLAQPLQEVDFPPEHSVGEDWWWWRRQQVKLQDQQRLPNPRRFDWHFYYLLSSFSVAGSLMISPNSFTSVLSTQDNAEFKKEQASHHFILWQGHPVKANKD